MSGRQAWAAEGQADGGAVKPNLRLNAVAEPAFITTRMITTTATTTTAAVNSVSNLLPTLEQRDPLRRVSGNAGGKSDQDGK
jgi:hypothetical protein